MNSCAYRMSEVIRISVIPLTTGARTPRLGRPQAQAARIAVGREVRRVDGDVGELLMHDALEKMGVGGLFPPPVHHPRVEITRSLAVGGVVTEERWLQQGAAAAVLAPPPGHVISTPDFDR